MLIAALVALAAPVTANAAMAGANAQSATNRPALRSITAVNATDVQFCFDKQIGTVGPPGSFLLGGYASVGSETPASSVVRSLASSSFNCATATFPDVGGGDRDLKSYSYGRVDAGAVTGFVLSQANLVDSSALIGSDSHSGTTGHTTAPDLTGVLADLTTNTISFVFDQKVGNANPQGFFYNGTDGVAIPGVAAGAVIADNVVRVTFPGPQGTVANAVRAYAGPGAVTSRTAGATPNPLESAVIPGGTGATVRPDFVFAALSADGRSIAFGYDQPIGTATANAFTADFSNGGTVTGTSTVIANTATAGLVTVTFPAGTNLVNEYIVEASAAAGAATTTAGVPSTAGGLPVGDNAGAFSSGFTDGPDAFRVTFNPNGDAAVTFDQRVAATAPAGFILIDGAGNPVGSASTATLPPPPAPPAANPLCALPLPPPICTAPAAPAAPAPGPVTVTAHFTPGQMGVAKSIQLTFAAVITNRMPATANVTQILSPTAPAAVIHRRTARHWRKATGTRRAASFRGVSTARGRALAADLRRRNR